MNPAYQKFNPLLFFAASCKNCFYTRELNSGFKEWQSNTDYKAYRLPAQKKKHLTELSDENSVIRLLGSGIMHEKRPDESAIIKLLLAIYDEKFLERPSPLDIARFYLRIAWIYRDENDDNESQSSAQLMLSKIQMEIDRLEKNVGEFENQTSPLYHMITDDFDPVICINFRGKRRY